MSKLMTLKPQVSEKSYGLSKTQQTYIFQVPLHANKTEIARAVSCQFDVRVASVNTAISKGKRKRTVRKSGKQIIGQRNDTKHAYVMLEEDQHIPVFAAIDEAAEKEKQAVEKAEKKEGKK